MNTVTINPISDEVLIVDLKTMTMTCFKGGEKYIIKMQPDGETYYYERSNIETEEIIDADITDIESLRNGGNLPGVVHWMARGYKGLPAQGLAYV